ncbi:putative glycerol-1-phosphate prenyltransferase [Salegentibacter holothuriorum]|uniref:Geranylgeranylglyceryl phosphate synthase n=1 Tax=Salegentibacter holothuriorum TaxID=241145 RepID=A0A1T5BKM1_9FLAO|nr:geranylgeranylglyceryl/heptaprenylglyceryl phosphate synthase [Salegentibacter holothuriorum]SKB47569.1 putative glycerol-1-phosphate prenyltransferase [Salegentibacter holothuriorum]
MRNFYAEISQAAANEERLLAILIDPDKFNEVEAATYLKKIPKETTHILVGGSTVEKFKTEKTVKAIKTETNLPVILFPGDYSQITETADALLFLSLLSGRNPEYLIEQQVKSVGKLKHSKLEIIPTAYILIDGGKECAVQRVSGTKPISQSALETVVNTALAGEFSGKRLIYLEAGSGAVIPVSEEIITEVKKAVSIPLVVGGGIRSLTQQENAYRAGADMIVMGTQFENL